ncbi:MAG: ABC-three component system protein [Sneathiella sp.]
MNKSDFTRFFDQKFQTCNQGDFEKWFAELAACAWGNDFELIKAGGKDGDKKSDGRRVSTETVYQSYAPESSSTFARNAAAKVRDSFPEVLEYWPRLSEWVFIHNNGDGIPTSLSDAIEKLRSEYPSIKISTVSRRFMKDELHDKLNISQLLDLYPMAGLHFEDVEMEHIRPLLKRIIKEKIENTEPADFGGIPDEKKLDHNDLSADSKMYLSSAYLYIGIVDRYLLGMSKPSNASVLQVKMRDKYLELKGYDYEPDEILGKLVSFVRGAEDDPKTMAAAYVVASYYFGACDIFENAPEEAPC